MRAILTGSALAAGVLLAACSGDATAHGDEDPGTITASGGGTSRGTGGPVPSPRDAGRPDAAPPDAGATNAADAASDADAAPVDDTVLCGPNDLVFTRRSQLASYGVGYTDADATLENFPVMQYRPTFGMVPWGAAFKDNVVAIRFRVPASGVRPDHFGFIAIAEAPGQNVTARQVCLSDRACDFSACPPSPSGTTADIAFAVGSSPAPGADVTFRPGQVVWVNIRNATQDGTPTCPYDECGFLFDFASPNRY